MARTLHPRNVNSTDDDADLLKHIQGLGLSTVEDYRQWCSTHGFSRRLTKHWRERQRERAFAQRAVADARWAQQRQFSRHPGKLMEAIFAGNVLRESLTDPMLREVSRLHAESQNLGVSSTLLKLLLHVHQHTDLWHLRPVIPTYGHLAGNTYLQAMLTLAHQPVPWLRPLADWKPRTHNPRRQFAELVRHLYAQWPVPTFMDSAWFAGMNVDALQRQAWWLHVGRGENIRTAELPVTITKRMAHHFMLAPADVTIDGALRWGQIHALGGSDRLCRAVIATRLGTDFNNDEFWVTVLRFFVENPLLDLAQVGPIVDYIYSQRFVPQLNLHADGPLAPPQPNFSMKGRSPATLLRQVESWHHRLARAPQYAAEWPASGIRAFRFLEGGENAAQKRLWTITELLSSKALMAEGRAMQHCVASYTASCVKRTTSIWSLEVEGEGGPRRVLTVEVLPAARLICQARGKRNAKASDKERSILRRWAEVAGLTLGRYV